MKKKIAIVGTVGIPAKYGGFETLTEQLVNELHAEFDFTVYCSSIAYKKRGEYSKAKRVFLPFNANGKSSIIYDFFSLIHAIFYADVILLLGVSAGFMIPVIRFFTSTKIITNIDGLEWKRDKWKGFAKHYLKSQEGIAVKHSHVVVSDNKAIQDYVKNQYNRYSNCIAYGGSHVSLKEQKTKENYAFSVCRIEPENNVHIILKAFSETTKKLIFVGNWNSSQYGKDLKREYENYKNINLLDPIYNQSNLDQLRANCKVYIHGHSAGGTNPSLVEAMWLGLPVFCWDVSYNKETTKNSTLYFNSSDSLIELLSIDDATLEKTAYDLKEIANKNYSWAVISKQYKGLLNGYYNNVFTDKVVITATIVLYENDLEMLKKAVNSFLDTPIDKKLFLIDNSETNVLEEHFQHDDIEYFFVGKNLGYGKANNKIIEYIKTLSSFHLILNPDVFFDKKVIPKLINELNTNKDLALIGPKTLYPEGGFQHSCRRYPSFFELLFRRLKIFKNITDKGEYKDIDLSKPFNPDFIQGAFLLFKTEDFVKLNGFDSRFFMYMEDVDICRRIDNLNREKLYFPEVEIYHLYTKGSAKNLKLFFYHFLSAIQYFYKWKFKK